VKRHALSPNDLVSFGPRAFRLVYEPAADADLDDALTGLQAVDGWPGAAYDGSRRHLAALKNLTSDLIGRFCASARAATFASYPGPLLRHRADLVVPEESLVEMAILKGIAAHYVMQADDRVQAMARQRELLAELVEALVSAGPSVLERPFAEDWKAAADDAARRRVLIDQVAALTDASAAAWHDRLV
jgi:dGTPase